MLGCPANKALITGKNPVVSVFLFALQAQLWVPAVNILWADKKNTSSIKNSCNYSDK